MVKLYKYFILAWAIFLTFHIFAYAQELKVADLINEGTLYNAQSVSVEGEAIGHMMQRGDFAWFNINDGTVSIGVWAPVEFTRQIKFLGRHAVVGDRVKINGIFHSHCSLHGGDTDIHADSIEVIEQGEAKQLAHDPKKVNVLVFLTGLMVCLYIIKTLKKPR